MPPENSAYAVGRNRFIAPLRDAPQISALRRGRRVSDVATSARADDFVRAGGGAPPLAIDGQLKNSKILDRAC
jgi:hypothetical protein